MLAVLQFISFTRMAYWHYTRMYSNDKHKNVGKLAEVSERGEPSNSTDEMARQ